MAEMAGGDGRVRMSVAFVAVTSCFAVVLSQTR